MKTWTDGIRWRSVATAALLIVAGGAMGVLVDRLWLSPPRVEATPLTAEALADRLGLSPAEEVHLRALLDSVQTDIHAAVAQEGPEALGTAVQDAQLRIEEALPPDTRSDFRAWMQEHHERMMDRMRGGPMNHEMMHGPSTTPVGAP